MGVVQFYTGLSQVGSCYALGVGTTFTFFLTRSESSFSLL